MEKYLKEELNSSFKNKEVAKGKVSERHWYSITQAYLEKRPLNVLNGGSTYELLINASDGRPLRLVAG